MEAFALITFSILSYNDFSNYRIYDFIVVCWSLLGIGACIERQY